MDKDWLFESGEYICDLRTVGVLLRNHKILVQRDRDGVEFALPGGHVRMGETFEDGLIREYKEETGADILCKRLLWSEECFWKWNGKQAHSIAFYYQIELCEGSEISIDDFISHKDNCNVVLTWMPIDEMKNHILYPEFLKKEIFNLHDYPKHFITKE